MQPGGSGASPSIHTYKEGLGSASSRQRLRLLPIQSLVPIPRQKQEY
jgi:hypothetical protein